MWNSIWAITLARLSLSPSFTGGGGAVAVSKPTSLRDSTARLGQMQQAMLRTSCHAAYLLAMLDVLRFLRDMKPQAVGVFRFTNEPTHRIRS